MNPMILCPYQVPSGPELMVWRNKRSFGKVGNRGYCRRLFTFGQHTPLQICTFMLPFPADVMAWSHFVVLRRCCLLPFSSLADVDRTQSFLMPTSPAGRLGAMYLVLCHSLEVEIPVNMSKRKSFVLTRRPIKIRTKIALKPRNHLLGRNRQNLRRILPSM